MNPELCAVLLMWMLWAGLISAACGGTSQCSAVRAPSVRFDEVITSMLLIWQQSGNPSDARNFWESIIPMLSGNMGTFRGVIGELLYVSLNRPITRQHGDDLDSQGEGCAHKRRE